MILTIKLFIILSIVPITSPLKPRCGFDNSPLRNVQEGLSNIEAYPWLGRLRYTHALGNKYVMTAVVLITVQLVLAGAADIEKIPKNDFRDRARVYLGYNCSGPGIGILEYNYHPDYSKSTFSALVVVQLDPSTIKGQKLRPACSPPPIITSMTFYAFTISDDWRSSEIRIHRMEYVPKSQCKKYYRRASLDVKSLWPSHTACARALWGGECVWRSGAVLMLKQDSRWSLVGYGVQGPGCEAPSRFIDYGMYHQWVKTSIARIGFPAITRVDANHLILRRSPKKIQRYGLCDYEETKTEIFTDKINLDTIETEIMKTQMRLWKTARYNLSLFANVDYSCAVFKSESDFNKYFKQEDLKNALSLRHWCQTTEEICYSTSNLIQIAFYVEVLFIKKFSLNLKIYGRGFKSLDMKKALSYLNSKAKPIALDFLQSSYAATADEIVNM